MDYKEALEKIIASVTKEKGAQKELDGLFEELPGELAEVLHEQIFQDVRYVVIDRLIHTAAINEMSNEQIDQIAGDLSLLISVNIAHKFLERVVENAEPKEPEPVGYA